MLLHSSLTILAVTGSQGGPDATWRPWCFYPSGFYCLIIDVGRRFTKMPSPARLPISETQVASDLQIEQWVQKEYGFIPHPFWIRHCKELYIQGPGLPVEGRRPWHECPLDKRPAIKAAFFHFGMLPQ
jgi:hypothetical protein